MPLRSITAIFSNILPFHLSKRVVNIGVGVAFTVTSEISGN